MALIPSSGPFTTVAANQPLTWNSVFPSGSFVGPIAVAPNFFPGGDDNYGTLTAGLVTIQFNADSGNPVAYNQGNYVYQYTVTSGSPWPLMYNISIGTFE
jgi:hypothetical protein